MKRSILLSVLMIGAVLALVGIGSWAVFSDTESASGNIVTAGSLNLEVGTTDGGAENCDFTDPFDGPLFSIDNASPGDETEATVCLWNSGSLPGDVIVDVTKANGAENDCIEPEDEAGDDCDPAGDLAANVLIDAWVDGTCDNINADPTLEDETEENGDLWFFHGTVADLVGLLAIGPVPLAADQTVCIGVMATVDENAGNEIMTDSIGIDVDLTLTQTP
jgi:predicted ribosomally synthesized peptide with SipW-like signal peptide